MPTTPALIPVAQYLRKSHEHEQYSLENQAAAIAEYAALNGFAIIATYVDSCKSGLVIRNREGLRRLLRDVRRRPEFRAVLVFDVSRWGRFQDVDESAHYEFMCKRAGIPIHYCAEQFANDGSLSSLILKSLKRAMAAEFSRELGEKVHRGKKRIVQMGYRVGGRASFGLRRLLVSADGAPKQLLRFGERKSISSDRVTLVLGPRREVEIVRLMFQLVLEKGYRSQRVTDFLNEMGIKFSNGKRWTRETVDAMLRNPKYIGTNVWGRVTSRLHTRTRSTPEDQWTTRPGSFPALIDRSTFDEVQRYLDSWWWSDEELLQGLREVWKREGRLTEQTLSRATYAPCVTTLKQHFGSYKKALELIGYKPPRDLHSGRRRGKLRKLHRDIVQRIGDRFPSRLAVVKRRCSSKRELLMDGRHRIAVVLASPRCTSPGTYSWRAKPTDEDCEIPALCCLLSQKGMKIISMRVCSGFPSGHASFALHPGTRWFDDGKNLRTLNGFCRTMDEIIANRRSP